MLEVIEGLEARLAQDRREIDLGSVERQVGMGL
jgi:hypothetical protein